jgi:RHS repeat-associated protein
MVAFAENKLSPAGAALNGRHADFSSTPSGTQPLVNNLYQGMALDAVTGLYYERNRDYSPTLGRWMEQDPAQYIDGANTYQFVMGNPIDRLDPSGMWSWSELWPWNWPIFHSTPVRAAKHAAKYVVPGGEFCGLARALPAMSEQAIEAAELHQEMWDMEHKPRNYNPAVSDPLYMGLDLMRTKQLGRMTARERAAVIKKMGGTAKK